MKLAKYVLNFFVLFVCILGISCRKTEQPQKAASFSVVTTSFPCYDMARAVCGTGNIKKNQVFSGITPTNSQVKMLIKPGTELHSYDPSPADIVAIENADLFVYIGGDSDAWVERLLQSMKNPPKSALKLMDYVTLVEEEIVEGMEAEEEEHEEEEAPEMDEHIWTSPSNAIILVNAVAQRLSELRPEAATEFTENAASYTGKIVTARDTIKEVINSKSNHLIVMGDRFPLRYFADEFGLDYRAAFPGCSSAVEASSATIAYLIDTVRLNNLPAVFSIELSNQKIAKTIAEATNVKVLELNSAHNLTKAQFDAELTYVDTLYSNALTLDAGIR